MLGRKLAGSELGRLADSYSPKYRKSSGRLIYMRRRSRYAVSEDTAFPHSSFGKVQSHGEIIRAIVSINIHAKRYRMRERSARCIDRQIGRINREQELERREERREGGRRPDLFMNAEIPRGSLGVPKHQRDCVPSRRYSITGLSEYPHPFLHPPFCWTLCYTILAIHATGHRHANEYL